MPIPGTTNLARIEENVRAAQLMLSAGDLQRIDAVAPHGVAVGTRYDPGMMRFLNG